LERVGGATLLTTHAPGDEARCTREALTRGATTIVALGGDGTVSQIACELVRAQSRVPLGIFSAGTGNDFAKSLGMPIHDFVHVAGLVAAGRFRTIDAARVDDRVFVNVAGFGFDAEVLARTLVPGLLRGNAVYLATAASQLFRYRGFRARIESVGRAPELPASDGLERVRLTPILPTAARRWLALVFANGQWFGGTFRIAPAARVADGMLDAVLIGDTSALRRAVLFARATSGRHLGEPEVQSVRHEEFELHFDAPPQFEADGEL
jgi:diacylglycerol kinase (ATP)